MENPAFDFEKMKRFILKDKLLLFVWNDRGRQDHWVEIIFNSYVLDDSLMIQEYLNS